jgi:uncharacterized membrane protein (UPF0127 family)
MIATAARGTCALAITLVLLGGCSGCRGDVRPPQVLIRTATGRVVLSVDVATTPGQQARGLMGRAHLAADDGMAFVFGHRTTTSFWMKHTRIPLSIAFWNRRGRIVDILDMRPCTHAPCRLYRSSRPYVGAVEANRGYFGRHGVRIGDGIELSDARCG